MGVAKQGRGVIGFKYNGEAQQAQQTSIKSFSHSGSSESAVLLDTIFPLFLLGLMQCFELSRCRYSAQSEQCLRRMEHHKVGRRGEYFSNELMLETVHAAKTSRDGPERQAVKFAQGQSLQSPEPQKPKRTRSITIAHQHSPSPYPAS